MLKCDETEHVYFPWLWISAGKCAEVPGAEEAGSAVREGCVPSGAGWPEADPVCALTLCVLLSSVLSALLPGAGHLREA